MHERTWNVEPYDPSIGVAKSSPIVDAALAYTCPISNKTYILLARNVLHATRLNLSLIDPFIMKEASAIVNKSARIHISDP